MKHISRVPSGWMYRRVVQGDPVQEFFSDQLYGSQDKALEAAMAFRSEMNSKYGESEQAAPRSSNRRNRTGIVGVSWNIRRNAKNGVLIHSFRAQVPTEDGGTTSKAFSVLRYGLWDAYHLAANWRSTQVTGEAMDIDEVAERFVDFMAHYTAEIPNAGDLSQEMLQALMSLMTTSDLPPQVREAALAGFGEPKELPTHRRHRRGFRRMSVVND